MSGDFDDLLRAGGMPRLPEGYMWRIGEPTYGQEGACRVEIWKRGRRRDRRVEYALSGSSPRDVQLAVMQAATRAAIKEEW